MLAPWEESYWKFATVEESEGLATQHGTAAVAVMFLLPLGTRHGG
jgi:hypothetical protein